MDKHLAVSDIMYLYGTRLMMDSSAPCTEIFCYAFPSCLCGECTMASREAGHQSPSMCNVFR